MALLLAYVILVMGPKRGGTIFSLLGPFILATSTNLVTNAGYGMYLFLLVDLMKSLMMHHITTP